MVTLFSMKRTVGFVAVPLLAINAYLAQPAVSVSMVSQSCGQVSVKEPPIDLRTVVDEFVKSIPAGKTYGYADPKGDPNGVNALVQGFAKIVDGDLVAACQVLEPVAYRVILTTDNNTGRDLVLLRETRGNNGYARAWGLYVISWLSAASSSALAVEAPHSCPYLTQGECAEGDRLTHFVAVRVFREANARYLFINGADRSANDKFGADMCEQVSRCADVAHQPGSPFEKIHDKAVSGLGSGAKVYQSHRFLFASHRDVVDNYPPGTSGPANVVVSTGTTTPSPIAKDVARRIEDADRSFFHVCLFNDLDDCSQLGATKNVQKDHMSGGRFVHVEASDGVVQEPCGTPCRRDQLASAIAEAMK